MLAINISVYANVIYAFAKTEFPNFLIYTFSNHKSEYVLKTYLKIIFSKLFYCEIKITHVGLEIIEEVNTTLNVNSKNKNVSEAQF